MRIPRVSARITSGFFTYQSTIPSRTSPARVARFVHFAFRSSTSTAMLRVLRHRVARPTVYLEDLLEARRGEEPVALHRALDPAGDLPKGDSTRQEEAH